MSHDLHEPEVVTSRRGEVLEIRLNRPHRRNAVDRAMAVLLAEAVGRLDDDDALRVGLLYGAGGTFCSGMDLKAFVDGERPVVDKRGFAGLVERPPRKPLVAAVEGHALAGGFEIALACDLVVADERAVFGLPEVRRGLVAAGGGLLRLAERVPPAVAMDIALTGRQIGAREAYGYGLVSRVAPPGAALDLARSVVAEIAANAPLAVAASKEVLVRSLAWPEDEKFARQQVICDAVRDSDDAREGALAFAERRSPRWTGSVSLPSVRK